jgi:hypothetical protein
MTVPAPALVLCFADGLRLPPPWFVPVEAPACGQVLDVPAEQTNDDTGRRFVCDRLAGHPEHRKGTPYFVEAALGDRHRQVTDNDQGTIITWEPAPA